MRLLRGVKGGLVSASAGCLGQQYRAYLGEFLPVILLPVDGQRHTGVEVAMTSMVAGGAERLTTLARHTPCAGMPRRTSQRTSPWLG